MVSSFFQAWKRTCIRKNWVASPSALAATVTAQLTRRKGGNGQGALALEGGLGLKEEREPPSFWGYSW